MVFLQMGGSNGGGSKEAEDSVDFLLADLVQVVIILILHFNPSICNIPFVYPLFIL